MMMMTPREIASAKGVPTAMAMVDGYVVSQVEEGGAAAAHSRRGVLVTWRVVLLVVESSQSTCPPGTGSRCD